jgi:hypothetical protein
MNRIRLAPNKRVFIGKQETCTTNDMAHVMRVQAQCEAVQLFCTGWKVKDRKGNRVRRIHFEILRFIVRQSAVLVIRQPSKMGWVAGDGAVGATRLFCSGGLRVSGTLCRNAATHVLTAGNECLRMRMRRRSETAATEELPFPIGGMAVSYCQLRTSSRVLSVPSLPRDQTTTLALMSTPVPQQPRRMTSL